MFVRCKRKRECEGGREEEERKDSGFGGSVSQRLLLVAAAHETDKTNNKAEGSFRFFTLMDPGEGGRSIRGVGRVGREGKVGTFLEELDKKTTVVTRMGS